MKTIRLPMGDTNSTIEKSPVSWLPVSSPGNAPAVPSAGTLVEFRIGLGSFPYLTDHGFHDMVVLPGSFYIELVRQIHRDLFQRDAISLRHIEFERPVILAEDNAITVRVEGIDHKRVAYALFEATSDDLRNASNQQPCARLEVDLDSASTSQPSPSFDSNRVSPKRRPSRDNRRVLP